MSQHQYVTACLGKGRVVGEGTFGAVRKCYKQQQQGKGGSVGDGVVAVKYITIGNTKTDSYKVEAFEREEALLKQLKSAATKDKYGNYIPHLQDTIILNNNMLVLVSDWVEGMTLFDFWQQREEASITGTQQEFTVPPRAMSHLLETAFGGLSLLHKYGVAHRDIKDDNLMIRGASVSSSTGALSLAGPRAGIVIIDVGNGCVTHDATGTGTAKKHACDGPAGVPTLMCWLFVQKWYSSSAARETKQKTVTDHDYQRADVWSMMYVLLAFASSYYIDFTRPKHVPTKAVSSYRARSLAVAENMEHWVQQTRKSQGKDFLYATSTKLNTAIADVMLATALKDIPLAKEIAAGQSLFTLHYQSAKKPQQQQQQHPDTQQLGRRLTLKQHSKQVQKFALLQTVRSMGQHAVDVFVQHQQQQKPHDARASR